MGKLSLAVLALALLGCPGGGGNNDGGGGGGGSGGSGGGSADAGPVNPLPTGYEAAGRQVVIAADGKVMVLADGYNADSGTERDLLVARFNANLTRDTSWGRDGVATADFDGGTQGGIISLDNDFGVAGAFDGTKFVAVGSARGESAGGYDFALARFTASGQLDTTFGTGGQVLAPWGQQNAGQLNNIAVLASGKYLVCGAVTNGGARGLDHALIRYNNDGTVDGTFGNGTTAGIVADFGSDNELCGTLLLQGDKPLAAGRDFTIARFTANGLVDTTFGTNGAYKTTGHLGGAHLRTDGKIWLVGDVVIPDAGGNDVSYLKQVLLSADGVPDSTFGTGGVLTTAYNLSQVRGSAMQGAKLVLYIPNAPAKLIRLNADGTIDSTFGTSGAIAVPFKLPFFDSPFDPHHHLTVVGNTAWVTDVNLVDVTPTLLKSWLGVFSTPLP